MGLARDGEDAVAKARELRPDVVSMDINMPKLDGITALQIILQEKICPVVMVSSLTQRGPPPPSNAWSWGRSILSPSRMARSPPTWARWRRN